MAHIWIAESGISNEIEPDQRSKDNLHPVELFCNEVAANALIPNSIMLKLNPNIFNSIKEVFKTSKSVGISSFALIYRALKLDLIKIDRYRSLKDEAQKEFEEFLYHEEEKKARQK